MKYFVDGLKCDTVEHANLLAARLYKRYEGYRSINIIEEDSRGNREILITLEASKTPEKIDNEDWVG